MKIKRILMLLLLSIFLMLVGTTAAYAEEVTYYDGNDKITKNVDIEEAGGTLTLDNVNGEVWRSVKTNTGIGNYNQIKGNGTVNLVFSENGYLTSNGTLFVDSTINLNFYVSTSESQNYSIGSFENIRGGNLYLGSGDLVINNGFYETNVTVNAGNGSLTAKSSDRTAISLDTRYSVTVKTGTLIANGGDGSSGISSSERSSISVSGGTLIAKGGAGASGISLNGIASINVTGGILETTGGEASESSGKGPGSGLQMSSSVTVSAGWLIAQAGEGSDTGNSGIVLSSDANLNVNGGSITATGQGSSSGISLAGTSKAIVSSGILQATGSSEHAGISAESESSVEVSGGTLDVRGDPGISLTGNASVDISTGGKCTIRGDGSNGSGISLGGTSSVNVYGGLLIAQSVGNNGSGISLTDSGSVIVSSGKLQAISLKNTGVSLTGEAFVNVSSGGRLTAISYGNNGSGISLAGTSSVKASNEGIVVANASGSSGINASGSCELCLNGGSTLLAKSSHNDGTALALSDEASLTVNNSYLNAAATGEGGTSISTDSIISIDSGNTGLFFLSPKADIEEKLEENDPGYGALVFEVENSNGQWEGTAYGTVNVPDPGFDLYTGDGSTVQIGQAPEDEDTGSNYPIDMVPETTATDQSEGTISILENTSLSASAPVKLGQNVDINLGTPNEIKGGNSYTGTANPAQGGQLNLGETITLNGTTINNAGKIEANGFEPSEAGYTINNLFYGSTDELNAYNGTGGILNSVGTVTPDPESLSPGEKNILTYPVFFDVSKPKNTGATITNKEWADDGNYYTSETFNGSGGSTGSKGFNYYIYGSSETNLPLPGNPANSGKEVVSVENPEAPLVGWAKSQQTESAEPSGNASFTWPEGEGGAFYLFGQFENSSGGSEPSPPPSNYYTVQASVSPAGSGTVNGSASFSQSYISGAMETLRATPASGWHFTGWKMNGTIVSRDNPMSVTVDSDLSYTALFARNTVITPSVTFTPNSLTLTQGQTETVKITVSPQVGYIPTVSSSNPKVATASYNTATGEITVKAISPGKCQVMVYVGGTTAAFPVTVEAPELEEIIVTPNPIYLAAKKGEGFVNSRVLTLTSVPEGIDLSEAKVMASTSKVATVAKNPQGQWTITAVEDGTAEVTVEMDDVIITVPVVVSSENAVINMERTTITANSPDFYTVTVAPIVNPAVPEAASSEIRKVSLFTWSQVGQTDIDCKVANNNGNGTWSYTFPVNNTPVNNYYLDASDIIVQTYASTNAANDGNMIMNTTWNYADCGWTDDVIVTPYVQNRGFIIPSVGQGAVAGTTGKNVQMEGVRISTPIEGLDVIYDVHAQDLGWMDQVSEGEYAGTMHANLQIEAIHIRLTGPNASKYSVQYQAHVENLGWMPWVQNGGQAGTTGRNLQLEALRIRIVPAGTVLPSN